MKTPLLALSLVATGSLAIAIITARPASGQVEGSVPSYIKLQAATPGTPQSGNANVTGTFLAGRFLGSGSFGLNAAIKGTNSSTVVLSAGVTGEATATSGTVYGVTGLTASPNGRAIAGFANATSGASYAGYFTNSSTSGYGLYAKSDGPYGLYGEVTASSGSIYGVYGTTQSTSGNGVFGTADATSGTTYGGRFESASTTGRGVFGWATAASGDTRGVYGRSDSTAGSGVRGLATANSGTTFGGQFESQSSLGTAVSGVASSTTGVTVGGSFKSSSPLGTGVLGWANNSTGDSYGVYGLNNSATGIGVYGKATAPDDSVGVWAEGGDSSFALVANMPSSANAGIASYSQSYSEDFGNAVRGYVPSPTATNARGVYGIIESDKPTNYAVLGQGQGTTSWGVYAFGKSGASGTKSFRIDHPLDPTNKYLLHYSTESPTPQNFYTGNVVTDAQGKAWVTLPDYFHEINVNFKYQLTVVDDSESTQFVQVKVGKEIANGRFLIMSSAPRTKVSWRVDADRNDLFVRADKPKDVVMKEPSERGKYQSPELYGKPRTMGTMYDARTERKVAFAAKRMQRNPGP